MAQNLPRGTPARVLVLLALLMGLVAVSAWRDALRRDAANWIRHPTALGDTGFFVPGQAPVQLTTGGKAITLTAGKAPFHRRDDRMYRVTTGFGDNLPFSVFSTKETLETEAEPRLYARTAPHQFLRLRAALTASTVPSSTSPPLVPVPLRTLPETPVRKAIPLGPEDRDLPEGIPEKQSL